MVTRCFGYELPGIMLLPYADLANHHCIDGAFDIYNQRIQAQGQEATQGDEKAYWYRYRKGFNYTKHFVEEPFDSEFPLNYKTTMYAKKVELRNQILAMTSEQFLTSADYQNKDIWETKFASTSESSEDSEDSEESSEEIDSDDPEQAEKIEKGPDFTGGSKIPQVFKTFRARMFN